ncbi:MAG: thioredoxin [Bacteroidaceae bacterium]|nr:thioredoxin [Bacteroidaceae bacterium]
MNVKELSYAEFKNKIMDPEVSQEWNFKGDKPVIIDFYAQWCGPCKATAPVLDALAGEYQGQIEVYKVDVDKEEELSSLFGIRSIPSILFIPKNDKPQMRVGAMGRQDLDEAIKSILIK